MDRGQRSPVVIIKEIQHYLAHVGSEVIFLPIVLGSARTLFQCLRHWTAMTTQKFGWTGGNGDQYSLSRISTERTPGICSACIKPDTAKGMHDPCTLEKVAGKGRM